MAEKLKLTEADFEKTFDNMCHEVRVKCEFTRQYIGGLPSDDKGLEAYIKYHLKLEGEEATQAFERIKAEEQGKPKDVTPEEGEVKEQKTYGINCCYRDREDIVWIPDWQLKACLKHAASSLGLFRTKRGSKGPIAELGSIIAHGISNGGKPYQIRPKVNDQFITDHNYRTFRGSVSTPAGKTSIVHTNEVLEEGTQFEFKIKWFADAKLEVKDIADCLSAMRTIGLGSAKSYENGQFKILEFEEL